MMKYLFILPVLLFQSLRLWGAELTEHNEIYIQAGEHQLEVRLENNSSAKALVEKLRAGDDVIQMEDYARMEKVGPLGYSLVTNDQPIDAVAGDVILYQGKYLVIYYDKNSWQLTRLGKVTNASQQALKKILGNGNIEIVLSLKAHEKQSGR